MSINAIPRLRNWELEFLDENDLQPFAIICTVKLPKCEIEQHKNYFRIPYPDFSSHLYKGPVPDLYPLRPYGEFRGS